MFQAWPAIAEPTDPRIVIEDRGLIVADTCAAIRIPETSHPPSYYIPLADIVPYALRRAEGQAWSIDGLLRLGSARPLSM